MTRSFEMTIKQKKTRFSRQTELFHSLLTEEKNSGFSRVHNIPYVFKEDLMKRF